MYHKCKNKWGPPTSFWRYDIWKCTLILRNRSSVFDTTSAAFGTNILWTSHWKQFIWVDLLNEYIPLLKSPEVKLILNNCISKLAELQSVGTRSRGGRERGKKINFQHWFFVHILTIGRNLSKKAMCLKKVGVTDLFKPQNPGEVVVLAKSATFADKSSSVRALDEWRGAIATWICVGRRDAQKQLARTSLNPSAFYQGLHKSVQEKPLQ